LRRRRLQPMRRSSRRKTSGIERRRRVRRLLDRGRRL